MTSHEDFQKMMAANPDDYHTRAVYADFLDDHGQHESAAKLRWWAGALAHLEHAKPPSRTQPGTRSTEAAFLPEWVTRLNHVRTVGRVMGPSADEHEKHWLAEAELHALGLLPTERFDRAREETLRHRAADAAHSNLNRRMAFRGLFNINSHREGYYPPHDAVAATSANQPTGYSVRQNMEHAVQTQHLIDYKQKNEAPVKLALGWLRGNKAPAAEPVNMGTWHVRNAVQDSLRAHGAIDPAQHLDKYVAAVTRFVNDKPEDPRSKIITGLLRAGTPLAHKQLAEAVHPVVGAATKVLPFVRAAPPSPPTSSAPAVAHEPVPQVSSQPGPVEEPLPLDEPETPEPQEDRHAAVLRLLREGKGNDDIAKHLMETHGAKDRATALRWKRNALQRAILLHERSKGPAKLAKPKPGQLLNASHLKGQAYADPLTGEGRRVHPQIANTALAYHLRQIAQAHPELEHDADAALAWAAHSTNKDADPFANLGRKLEKAKSRFADYHDWKNLESHLLEEQNVEAWARKHVIKPGDMQDHNFFARVAKQLGRGGELAKRLKGMDAGKTIDALHRLADRHLDKAYLAAKPEPQEYREVFGRA